MKLYVRRGDAALMRCAPIILVGTPDRVILHSVDLDVLRAVVVAVQVGGYVVLFEQRLQVRDKQGCRSVLANRVDRVVPSDDDVRRRRGLECRLDPLKLGLCKGSVGRPGKGVACELGGLHGVALDGGVLLGISR